MPFLLILVVIILILVFTNVRVIGQSHQAIIERLGKYHATWDAGLHLKVPFVDRVARIVSLKEQVMDFPPQPVITKDNVTMQIDSVVFCKVFDARLYTYGVENPIVGLQNLAATTLRNIIGEMELDQTLTSRDAINSRLERVLDDATDPWGLKVTRVEIKNINPPEEVEQTMLKQMKAERDRRQTVLEAQAHQEAVVSRAEGDKKAKILAAEAERDAQIALAEGDKRAKILAAEAERDAQIALAEGRSRSIELVYEAEARGLRKLNEAGITEPVLKLKGIEALKDVSDGRATKIYMPSDLSNIITNLGVAGEALGIGDNTPVDKSPKPEKALESDPCIDEETGTGGREAAAATAYINREVSR